MLRKDGKISKPKKKIVIHKFSIVIVAVSISNCFLQTFLMHEFYITISIIKL